MYFSSLCVVVLPLSSLCVVSGFESKLLKPDLGARAWPLLLVLLMNRLSQTGLLFLASLVYSFLFSEYIYRTMFTPIDLQMNKETSSLSLEEKIQ